MLQVHADDGRLLALAHPSRGFLLASVATDGRVVLWQSFARSPEVGRFGFPPGEASTLA